MDFLKIFTQIFKSIDEQKHGILIEDEFRSLLEVMHSSCGDKIDSRKLEIPNDLPVNFTLIDNEQEIFYLLQQVDPFNHNHITFSEVVQLLSSHMAPSENPFQVDSVPLLEKFSNLHNFDQVKLDALIERQKMQDAEQFNMLTPDTGN